MVPQCLVIIQVLSQPPTFRFLGSLMFLTFLTIYFLWDNQPSWVIILPLIILGVLCRIQGRDRSLGSVPELGVCFPWIIFVFHMLLLFLLLLQFFLYLPLHFGMPDLVTHLPLGYNTWLLEVCWVQCPQKILIFLHYKTIAFLKPLSQSQTSFKGFSQLYQIPRFYQASILSLRGGVKDILAHQYRPKLNSTLCASQVSYLYEKSISLGFSLVYIHMLWFIVTQVLYYTFI